MSFFQSFINDANRSAKPIAHAPVAENPDPWVSPEDAVSTANAAPVRSEAQEMGVQPLSDTRVENVESPVATRQVASSQPITATLHQETAGPEDAQTQPMPIHETFAHSAEHVPSTIPAAASVASAITTPSVSPRSIQGSEWVPSANTVSMSNPAPVRSEASASRVQPLADTAVDSAESQVASLPVASSQPMKATLHQETAHTEDAQTLSMPMQKPVAHSVEHVSATSPATTSVVSAMASPSPSPPSIRGSEWVPSANTVGMSNPAPVRSEASASRVQPLADTAVDSAESHVATQQAASSQPMKATLQRETADTEDAQTLSIPMQKAVAHTVEHVSARSPASTSVVSAVASPSVSPPSIQGSEWVPSADTLSMPNAALVRSQLQASPVQLSSDSRVENADSPVAARQVASSQPMKATLHGETGPADTGKTPSTLMQKVVAQTVEHVSSGIPATTTVHATHTSPATMTRAAAATEAAKAAAIPQATHVPAVLSPSLGNAADKNSLSRERHEPRVQIGTIEVIVESSPAVQQKPSPSTGFTRDPGRYYQRRL